MNINNNQEVQQIEIINDKVNEVVIKPKKKYIYVKKTATTKMCKICNIEKLLELFNVNQNVIDKPIRYKNVCLECKKEQSKKYYEENKNKVLKSIKTKKENEKKKHKILIKFNDINDLENIIKNLKYKLENNLMNDNERKPYTYIKSNNDIDE